MASLCWQSACLSAAASAGGTSQALDAPGLPVGRNAIKKVLRCGGLEKREQAERAQGQCVERQWMSHARV